MIDVDTVKLIMLIAGAVAFFVGFMIDADVLKNHTLYVHIVKKIYVNGEMNNGIHMFML